MPTARRTIVWFRGKDLRIADHAPLRDACADGEVLPLFVLDPFFFAPERAARHPHRIQFLLDSLRSLADNLAHRGTRLIVVRGRSVDVVPKLAEKWAADRVAVHRWVEPFARERDRRIGEALGDRLRLYEGETLHPPGTLRTNAGEPYSVFTPFARSFRSEVSVPEPLAAPRSVAPVPDDVEADEVDIPSCEDLGITRNDDLLSGGERAARERLERFVEERVDDYHEERDRMDRDGTSRLSTDLKFGTISIRTVWSRVEEVAGATDGGRAFLNELIWREFSHSTLWDRPELLERPFREKFAAFPWEHDDARWRAWVEGKTGYPIVDASARQLLGEGFVHNRARMISASFLAKHLLLPYAEGEAHYMRYLSDGDWAQNNMGWQWAAGCGCDAQPYFRIFNPTSQGKKHDPEGDYVRRWVPELRDMPTKLIHAPWEAPEHVLERAGVRLGATYPRPIVDHKTARRTFLDLADEYLKH